MTRFVRGAARRWQPWVTIAMAMAAGTVLAQDGPRIKVGPNVMVSWDSDGAVWEMTTAANPKNPSNILAGGILVRSNHPRGGQENRGFYSLDGGATWRTIRFPEQTLGVGGDPMVIFGKSGTAFFASLAHGDAFHMYRSPDGGVTWDRPFVIGPGHDHEMLAADHSDGRFGGRVYVSALYKRGVFVYRTEDDGRTWLGPVQVAAPRDRERDKVTVQAESMGVFSDGEVLASFMEYRTDNFTAFRSYRYGFATSKDGGVSFGPEQWLRTASGEQIYGSANPVFAIDTSNGPYRDRVYAAFYWLTQDGKAKSGENVERAGGGRVYISYSSNRGRTWSEPKPVDGASPDRLDQYLPAMAVNPDGTLGISWTDDRDGASAARRYFAASIDGGASFLPAVSISSEPSDVNATLENVLGATVSGSTVTFQNGTGKGQQGGHYLAMTASTDGTFHPVWPDGRTGTFQMWTARVRVERSPRSGRPATLVEADVTKQVEVVLDPLRSRGGPAGVELPIRLKNVSTKPIYGPIRVEVTAVRPAAAILNAGNGQSGVGATFDYSTALGDADSLAAGAISERIVWRFRQPTRAAEMPSITVKVTARVEADR